MNAAAVKRSARILVTRPEADSGPLADELAARGHKVLRQPLLQIVFEDGSPPNLSDVQALLFTSANGVRAFARRSDRRDLPAYTVGDATARAARDAGFDRVESAGGDVNDLAALIRRRCDPAAGVLFHAAGSAVAGDLAGLLGGVGYAVRRLALYRAEQAAALNDATRRALAEGAVDFALFFSPRSATGFARLVKDAGLADSCAGIGAICLSDAVGGAFDGLAWRRVTIAAEPTQAALLAALDEAIERDGSMTTDGETNGSGEPAAPLAAAEAVVERFGGIRPMATKLGVPVTTVQGWKNRGHIPENRHAEIRAAAREHGVDLQGLPAQDAPAAPTQPAKVEAPAAPNRPVAQAASQPPAPPKAAAGAAPEPAQDTRQPDSAGSEGETVAEAAPEATRARGADVVGWLALVLAILGIAGAATQPLWSPIVYRDTGVKEDLTARLAAVETTASKAAGLNERLATTDERLADLIRRVEAAPGVDPAEIAKLTGKLEESAGRTRAALDRLSQRLGAVEEQVRTPPAEVMAALSDLRGKLANLEKEIAAVDDRTTKLERRPLISGARIAAIAIAAGQLDLAVASGEPYAAALERLRALARDDAPLQEALAPLDADAAKGVPTLTALAADFARIVPRLAVDTGQAEGWLDGLMKKARALVNMRPVGVEGARSPVTRAERALADHDLAGAVAALAPVGGEAVAWRKAAERRLAASRALAAMQARVAVLLAREAAKTEDEKAAAGGKAAQ